MISSLDILPKNGQAFDPQWLLPGLNPLCPLRLSFERQRRGDLRWCDGAAHLFGQGEGRGRDGIGMMGGIGVGDVHETKRLFFFCFFNGVLCVIYCNYKHIHTYIYIY